MSEENVLEERKPRLQNVQDSYWMSRGIANLVPEPRTKNGAGTKEPRTVPEPRNQERYRDKEPRTVPEPRNQERYRDKEPRTVLGGPGYI